MKQSERLPLIAWQWVFVLGALKFLAHALTSGSYGYFRDELYFLDCGRHLQWGYVDDAPGIALLAKLALLLGGSLPVVRLIAAFGGVVTVMVAPLLAWEMGGGKFAQIFAGLCVLAAPIFLGMDSILCVGTFEPLFWMGCAWVALRISRTGESRLWLAFGALAGFGLLLKYTMGLVLVCLLLGVLLTPMRRETWKPVFWLGVGLAWLIFLPAFLWQVQNHFPLLEDMANIQRLGKNVVLSPFEFLWQQIEFLNPLFLPVWASGLVFLLRRQWTRFLGWFYLLLLVSMIALHAKNYYLAAVYPMLFAAGAVAIEQGLDRWAWSRGQHWPQVTLVALAAISFAVFVPLLLPVFSPSRLLAYQAALRVTPKRTEVHHDAPLEQRLSDQFGWPELARETANIYFSLSEKERSQTLIYAENYGEAGAINQFGPALGLPPAVCAHQAHSFWGPPSVERSTFICLGCGRDGLDRVFDSVTVAAHHHHPWGMAFENRPIYLCRGLRTPLRELWPRIRHWD